MFGKLKRVIRRKKRIKKDIEIKAEKVGRINIPPGFDPALMKKLMSEGYRTKSLEKLEKHLLKKPKAKRKKRRRKAKGTAQKIIKREKKGVGPVQELMPIEYGTENSSSVGILYTPPKKTFDPSLLPKPKNNSKK